MAEPAPGPWGRAPFFINTLLVQAITFVLRPTAIYRALELDVPPQWLGALGASFAVVPLLLAVPTGQMADRFGERRVVQAGAGITLLAALAFAIAAGSVVGLLAASVLLGVGHLCSVVGQQALVANSTPRDRYDTAFGRYTFVASAGQALGPGLIVLLGVAPPSPTPGRSLGPRLPSASCCSAPPCSSAPPVRPSPARPPGPAPCAS